MIQIKFTKMTGGGNDFVVINNIEHKITENKKTELAKKLCKRFFSIGADGLMFLEKSDKADFFYHHYNPDGSVAGICGNGSRCISLYAYNNNIAGNKMSFDTPVGIFHSEIRGDKKDVKVSFVPAKNIRLNIPVEAEGYNGVCHFILTGVPHCVVFYDSIDNFDINKIGTQLVHHKEFQPEMTNVNFIKIIDSNNIKIRTYERGLEEETLACGTGCISSAMISSILHGLKPPLYMHTKGGMVLEIDFKIIYENGKPIGANNITMAGPAETVFTGIIEIQ